ncbi:hypothetical protein [Pelomonas sp. BJYL3]|uniref:hypothetical protein n=1 Tax=Pelomonas sp. BJYL3 TaxID=2976697 RepID=UPI0022B519AB|nr:hypothetical protein [Pelomonas sp. BJYL3]
MGWFLVTVVVPLLAPLVLLGLFCFLPLPPNVAAQLRLLTPIKDGQLCWGAMGFCVSALYEIAEPGASARPLAHDLAGWANGGLIFLLLLSALLAAGGSVFPTVVNVPAGVRWPQHFATLLASVILTALAAAAYALVHFRTSGV